MADSETDYLELMEELSKIVSLWSGVRSQFVENGWHPWHAEIATMELMSRGRR